jgi:signal transduction histidine kinase
VWPALFLGAVWANATAGESLWTASGIALGNTLGPLLAVSLLQRRFRFAPTLATNRDVLGLVLVAVCGMALTASNGVIQLALGGQIRWSDCANVWWVWWLGDAMGVLLVAPFLLTWLSKGGASHGREKLFELGLLLVSVWLVSAEAFSSDLLGLTLSAYPLEYAVFPFVIWAAIRFGPRETAAVVLMISTIAVHATAREHGPSAATLNQDQRLLLLELFVAVVATTGLTLAATAAERARAESNLRRANDELEERVRSRTAELASANAELSAKNEEVESFVYIVSHDLRGPLVNMQGFSKELSTSCRELDAAVRGLTPHAISGDELARILDEDIPGSLRYISASATKLQRLTDALILLSRSGRNDYAKEPVDVSLLVRSTIDAMQLGIAERGVSVVVGELPSVLGDATALGQVFSNLIGNAIKYLDPKRPGRVEVSGAREGAEVHYRVTDNGLGIPKSADWRLFQVFQRFHPDMAPGEGMGLAIVKRVVQRHGGRVWVESQEGVGSTFHVSLQAEARERAA